VNFVNCMMFGSVGFVGDWLSLGASNTHRMSDLSHAMHVLGEMIHEHSSGHFGTIIS
jgi:hypothetical protein